MKHTIRAANAPRLALVLGSGGVRSVAALGIADVLANAGLEPDLVVGCSSGALFGACIAMGMGGGEGAFKIWFESPGHHVNMVRPGNTALGVGRWKAHWTANFGNGPRVMWTNDMNKDRVVVKGEVLKPDEPFVQTEERRGLPGLPAELFEK